MAIMFNFATDWTYDLFAEDMVTYRPAPQGAHLSERCSDRHHFINWFKTAAREFRAEWGDKDWIPCMYIGDAFAEELRDNGFSDYYKDIYGQRPHLPMWYYVTLLELPQRGDVGYTFCANPIRDAKKLAREVREEMI